MKAYLVIAMLAFLSVGCHKGTADNTTTSNNHPSDVVVVYYPTNLFRSGQPIPGPEVLPSPVNPVRVSPDFEEKPEPVTEAETAVVKVSTEVRTVTPAAPVVAAPVVAAPVVVSPKTPDVQFASGTESAIITMAAKDNAPLSGFVAVAMQEDPDAKALPPRYTDKDQYPGKVKVLEANGSVSVIREFFFVDVIDNLMNADKVVGTGRKGNLLVELPSGKRREFEASYIQFNDTFRAYVMGRAVYASANVSTVKLSDHFRDFFGMTNQYNQPVFVVGTEKNDPKKRAKLTQ